MNVFLSWSDSQSKELAKVINEWIPSVLQAVTPYFTPDIEKGARWSVDIAGELEKQFFGIICITRENIQAPWIMFEAGALSTKYDKSRVCPILFGVTATDIVGPLKQFQCTTFDKEDIKRLITTINNKLQEQKVAEKTLDGVFEKWWPELLDKVTSILNKEEAPAEPIRLDRDLLEEILMLTRRANSSKSASLNPKALIEVVESLIAVHGQQVHREGSYQDALDLLMPMQLPLNYLLKLVGRERDGVDKLIEKLKSLDFTAEAESGSPEVFFDDDLSDEDEPF